MHLPFGTVVLLFFLQVVLSRSPSKSPLRQEKTQCGYESCPKPKDGFINIHLIPHSHDDVGWLKTVDQYYYGVKNKIQSASVQFILDSVVQELLHDPAKRFIYVETAFFWKWWQEQSDTLRHQVKKLVNNGQLEFVGGAWSMHDEATTHYQSILENFSWGFRKLSDTFGKCGRPRIGWQIDPFGHSRESAYMMTQIGFDGLFVGRIDWEDKKKRFEDQTAEMIWYTDPNDHGNGTQLFTSVMYNTYSCPKGFCFDVNCNDEPMVDNEDSPEYNIPRRTAQFLAQMNNYTKVYRTDNVLVTMGEDFLYTDAHYNYKNMDKLIKAINVKQSNGSVFNVFYSTPSCYLKAVHESNMSFPAKYDDFFPYSSDPTAFWTGYFTSRPTIKYFERLGNNILQVCKQLYSLADLGPEEKGDLNAMREAMGVMQHHDAVTGTERQHVANDYARILYEGIEECGAVEEAAFRKLMPKNKKEFKMESCLLLNISSCAVTEDASSFVVTIYNPLSRPVDKLVRLPVASTAINYIVQEPKGDRLTVQLMPVAEEVKKIPGRYSKAIAELVFMAKQIPPLGFRSYYVTQSNEVKLSFDEPSYRDEGASLTTVGYPEGPLVSMENGRISSIEIGDKSANFSQRFFYYVPAIGNNLVHENRSSGAYIFRPNGSEIDLCFNPATKIHKGPVVTEIHISCGEWTSQVVRIFPNASYVEFQWLVGPIPIDENLGKEVITRYEFKDIHNDGEFYTDSNGKQFIKRKLNNRETWTVHLSERIPGNYYPVTTSISIEDDSKKVSIVTDRAQGGSSLNDGEIELMVHRRLTHDDAFGVGEALNETAFDEGLVARGSHFITMGSNADVRWLTQEKVLDSWLFFTATDMSFTEWKDNFNMEHSGIKEALPPNVQILSLEPWVGKSFLIRLEHVLDKGDHPLWSKPVKVNLKKLFHGWHIREIKETMLGANVEIGEVERFTWKTDNKTEEEPKTCQETAPETDFPDVILNPMQIRTFIVLVNA